MAGPAFDRNPHGGSSANQAPDFGTFVVQAPEAVRGVRLPLRMPVETIGREGWTAPSFLEAVTSGKVGTHAITEAASC